VIDDSRFKARLWHYRAENVFNPWAQCDPLDISIHTVNTRRLNLETHFDRDNIEYLMIGEAPGYRGCHFSGVPFTSEAQFPHRMTTRPHPWREASSTIVWATLRELGIASKTVMWNAYPFHPFEPCRPMSNRAPTNRELIDTADILGMVVNRFATAKRVAIGNAAYAMLTRLCVQPHYIVRHPSMGGARDFRQQMKQLIV
jgi:hypothetical protein